MVNMNTGILKAEASRFLSCLLIDQSTRQADSKGKPEILISLYVILFFQFSFLIVLILIFLGLYFAGFLPSQQTNSGNV